MNGFMCNVTLDFVGTINMCMSGGICVHENAQHQYCICPKGFSADFSLFRSRNCALPDNAYVIHTAIYVVVWCIVVFVVYKRIHSRRKKTINVYFVYMLLMFMIGFVIAGCAQNGNYETSVMLVSGMYVCMILIFFEVSKSNFVLASFSNPPWINRVAKGFDMLSVCSMFLVVIMSCLATAMLSSPNADFYLIAWFVVIWLCIDVGCLLTLHFTRRFIKYMNDIDSRSNRDETDSTFVRVKLNFLKMNKLFMLYVFSFTTFVVLFPLVWSYFGSIPYIWTILMFSEYAVLLIPLGVAHMYRPQKSLQNGYSRSSVKGNALTSKNNTH